MKRHRAPVLDAVESSSSGAHASSVRLSLLSPPSTWIVSGLYLDQPVLTSQWTSIVDSRTGLANASNGPLPTSMLTQLVLPMLVPTVPSLRIVRLGSS